MTARMRASADVRTAEGLAPVRHELGDHRERPGRRDEPQVVRSGASDAAPAPA